MVSEEDRIYIYMKYGEPQIDYQYLRRLPHSVLSHLYRSIYEPTAGPDDKVIDPDDDYYATLMRIIRSLMRHVNPEDAILDALSHYIKNDNRAQSGDLP